MSAPAQSSRPAQPSSPDRGRPPTAPRRPFGRGARIAVALSGLALLTGAGTIALARAGSDPVPVGSAPTASSTSPALSTPTAPTDTTPPSTMVAATNGTDGTSPSAGPGPTTPVVPTDGGPTTTAAPAPTTTAFVGSPDDPVSPGGPDAGPADWPAEGGCDTGYIGVCIPKPPARITCDQISETNFQVVGSDAQGLDPDGNGVACEYYNTAPNPDRTPEELEEFERMD